MANFEGSLWMPCCKTIVPGFDNGNTVTRECPACHRKFSFTKVVGKGVIDAREI
jgi:hypothetical protein